MNDSTDDEWQAAMAELHRLIERDFGERCAQHATLCAVCMVWRAYDDIVEIADVGIWGRDRWSESYTGEVADFFTVDESAPIEPEAMNRLKPMGGEAK